MSIVVQGQRVLQLEHRASVVVDDLSGDARGVDRRRLHAPQIGLDRIGLSLGRLQAARQGGAVAGSRHRIHQALNFAAQGQQARAAGVRRGIVFLQGLGEHRAYGALQLVDRFRPQQLVSHLCHQAAIDGGTRPGGAARAHRQAAILMHAAAVVATVDGHDGAGAGIAAEQPAEQRLRRGAAAGSSPARGPVRRRCVHAFPQPIAHDAQLGRVAHLPLAAWALDVAPAAGFRVFEPLPSVPDHTADVQLVVQHAQAAHAAPDDRAYGPGAAARARHAEPVELVNDGARAMPIGHLFEDPAHMRSLGLVDHHAAPAGDGLGAVAEASATGAEATAKLSGEAAVRLVAQVVEVQLVDQAACDAHHLAALGLRVIAIAGANEPDVAVLEALDDLVLLAHVAAQAVEAFDDQDVEARGERVGQQYFAAAAQGDGY